MTDNEKRNALRKYFAKPPGFAWLLLGVGVLVVLAGLAGGGGTYILLGILMAAGGGALIYNSMGTRPSDAQVDQWLEEDIQALIPKALSKCGLTEDELIGDPLAIRGPIYWEVTGVNEADLVFRKGEDGLARFGVYDVSIIFLTDQRLTAYKCYFNFLKNVALNESTTEYFYQDVVSVSTREISTSYTLPDNKKLVSAQAFAVQVPSGDAISVVVSAAKLEELTGARLPSTGAEKAVEVIRTMLRSKKGVTRLAQE